jgi:hypothetical protein
MPKKLNIIVFKNSSKKLKIFDGPKVIIEILFPKKFRKIFKNSFSQH